MNFQFIMNRLEMLREPREGDLTVDALNGWRAQSQMISNGQHQLSFASTLQMDEQKEVEELVRIIPGLWGGQITSHRLISLSCENSE